MKKHPKQNIKIKFLLTIWQLSKIGRLVEMGKFVRICKTKKDFKLMVLENGKTG